MDEDIRNRFRGAGRTSSGPQRPARPVRPVSRPTPRSANPVVRPQVPGAQPRPQAAPKANKKSAGQTPRGPLGYAAHTYEPPKSKSKKTKKSRKKVIVMSLVALLLIGGGVGAYFWKFKDGGNSAYSLGNGDRTPAPGNGVPNGTIPTERQQQQAAGTIRLVATGDMIAHDSVNVNARGSDGNYDYAKLMGNMDDYFNKADVRFCNQATPAGGEKFGISGYPVFNAPIAFSRGIESIGCNVINIGTNHTNDKGQPLIDAFVAGWDDREVLAVAGANRTASEQNRLRTFEVNDVTFAFLSFSTYSNNTNLTPHGLNMYSDTLATAQVGEARQNADIVVVSMRWGTEYSPDINAKQQQIAKKLTDLGADIILGHGPHVLEPVQKVKNSDGEHESVVWYSLGNFLNTQLETEALVGGFASMDIDAASKKITSIGFMPTYMHYDWTAAEKAAGNLLARKNLTMVPLDQAKDLLAKSQLGTSVEAQTKRVTAVLNKYTEVKIIPSSEF